MSFVIKSSESGDWFLVPYLKADSFVDDEYEGKIDYEITYIGRPENVRIIDYEIEK
jgi:hypothetical protein